MRAMIICAFLFLTAGCDTVAPKPSKPTQSSLKANYPNGLTAVEIFDLRSKCQKLIEQDPQFADYSSSVIPHYNPNTNRCYAESEGVSNTGSVTINLFDAQTNALLLSADKKTSVDRGSGMDYRSNSSCNFASSCSFDDAMHIIDSLMQDDADPRF